MPRTAAMRNTIRETWLDKKYWDSFGVDIHPGEFPSFIYKFNSKKMGDVLFLVQQ